MKIETIYPYLKRLSNKLNRKLNVGLLGGKRTAIQKELKDQTFIETVEDFNLFDPKDKYDFIVVDWKKIDLTAFVPYLVINQLTPNGWIAFHNNEANRAVVKEWRKANKIVSPLTTLEDIMFFQNENYLARIDILPSPVDKAISGMQEPASVPVPDWSGSHLKIPFLQKYGQYDSFVETGTYLGQTVEMVRRSELPWTKIYSIELNLELASNAKRYFEFDERIEIQLGDSVDKLSEICDNLQTNNLTATFWLDAHASGPLRGGKTGPCPLVQELNAILKTGNKNHTIFIDDRRLFGSAEWGGVKEEEIMTLLNKINPDYKILYLDGEVPEDIICATVVDKPIFREKQIMEVLSPSNDVMILEDIDYDN